MENGTTSTMIKLVTNDREMFEVSDKVVMQSQTIRKMIEDDSAQGVIQLSNVNAKTFAKVLEYCNWLVNEENASKPAKEVRISAWSSPNQLSDMEPTTWEKQFIADVDQANQFDLLSAAKYLDIKKLLDLIYQTVADMMCEMTVEEVRWTFNIVNDYTPEEEEEILRENQRAFND